MWIHMQEKSIFSRSVSTHSAWQTAAHGNVLTLRFPSVLPVMLSSTWQRANNISSELFLPISMETVSPQSRLDLSRLRNSKVWFLSFTLLPATDQQVFYNSKLGPHTGSVAVHGLWFSVNLCLQVCHLLLVRWLLLGRPTPLSLSSGPLRRSPTIWLATTLTSAWRGQRTGPLPITNLTRTPSMFSTKQKTICTAKICFCIIMFLTELNVNVSRQVCG